MLLYLAAVYVVGDRINPNKIINAYGLLFRIFSKIIGLWINRKITISMMVDAGNVLLLSKFFIKGLHKRRTVYSFEGLFCIGRLLGKLVLPGSYH
jgi:hypothetical protein